MPYHDSCFPASNMGDTGNKAANGSATVSGGGGGGDVGSMVHLAIWHGTVPRTGYH